MQKESFDSIHFNPPFVGEEGVKWFQCNLKINVINGYTISVAGDTAGDATTKTNRHYLIIFDPQNKPVTQKCFETISDEYNSIDFSDLMKAYNWCIAQSVRKESERIEFLNS
jgi:hypothetical protein